MRVPMVARASTRAHQDLRSRLISVSVATLIVDVLATLLFFAFERHAPGTQITDLGDSAFWTSTQLLTISSSLANPISAPARILDVLLQAYAISVYAVLSGSLAAFFLHPDRMGLDPLEGPAGKGTGGSRPPPSGPQEPDRPSGGQFAISAGGQRATIVEVGGGLREYEVDGRSVIDPYPADRMCDGAHGAPLIPWPNRLADGRYAFDGDEYQVPLTEPEKGNAIHGFLVWRPWDAVEHEADRAVMATRLYPREGYPFSLDIHVAYQLGPEGLTVTTTAENVGDRPCPFGHGQHPYLSPGRGLIDDCMVQLAGRTRICTDADRQLPTGREPVDGTAFDFLEPRRLEATRIDHAFTDLVRDPASRAWTRLWGPDGACAELWVDDTYQLVETFTGDTLASDRARRGLGTEPMTCPPNAFASGDGLIRLEPGESLTSTWGVRLS